MPAQWTRLVRFLAVEDSRVHWGQPLDGSADIGLLYESGRTIRCQRLASDDPLVGDGSLAEGPTLTVARLLAPVPEATMATTMRGLGANFPPPQGHPSAAAFKAPSTPVVFTKPATSIVGPGERIVLPKVTQGQDADYEVELAVVLRSCKDVSEQDALNHVLGYCIANDVSSRKLCAAGAQWGLGKKLANFNSRAQNYDSWCPLGPVLVSPRAVSNPQSLKLTAHLNGQLVQSDSTSSMVFSIAKLIARLSAGTTLPAGTVILSGTPVPIGRPAMQALPDKPSPWLKHGDVVALSIEGLGTLVNPVVEEGQSAVLKAKL